MTEFPEAYKGELISMGFLEKEGHHVLTGVHNDRTYGVDFHSGEIFRFEDLERITEDPEDSFLNRLKDIAEQTKKARWGNDSKEETVQEPEETGSGDGEETKAPVTFDRREVPTVIEENNCVVISGNNAAIQPLEYTQEQIETIRNTVAKGANENELSMFLHICERYGLDPFLKEIFYSPEMKTIMTSRDGYLKIAQRDNKFRGIKSAAVHENDNFLMNASDGTIEHTFGPTDRGNIVGAWAIVEREEREPVIQFAPFEEYKKNTGVWKNYPTAMICKCAEALALKRQFGITGLVTKEEAE